MKVLYMQADVLVRASHLHLITAPEQIEAAMNGTLFVEHRPVLVFKGMPAAKAAEAIYRMFAERRDLRGERFYVSHKLRSIVAKDQWDEYAKVGMNDFRRYIENWFQLATLEEWQNKPALVLANTLPLMQVPLYCQGRYITKELISLFPAID
jgi:hypothetical protein